MRTRLLLLVLPCLLLTGCGGGPVAATPAHEAALAVEASSRTATSNTEQSRIDEAFTGAKTALGKACAQGPGRTTGAPTGVSPCTARPARA